MSDSRPLYSDAELRAVRTYEDALTLVTRTFGGVTSTRRPAPTHIRNRAPIRVDATDSDRR